MGSTHGDVLRGVCATALYALTACGSATTTAPTADQSATATAQETAQEGDVAPTVTTGPRAECRRGVPGDIVRTDFTLSGEWARAAIASADGAVIMIRSDVGWERFDGVSLRWLGRLGWGCAPASSDDAALSYDGRWMVTGSDQARFFIWDLKRNVERGSVFEDAMDPAPWSAFERWWGPRFDRSMRITGAANEPWTGVLNTSRDGRHVIADLDGYTALTDAQGSPPLVLGATSQVRARFTPQGTLIYATCTPDEPLMHITVLDPVSLKITRHTGAPCQRPALPTLSKDGRWLAAWDDLFVHVHDMQGVAADTSNALDSALDESPVIAVVPGVDGGFVTISARGTLQRYAVQTDGHLQRAGDPQQALQKPRAIDLGMNLRLARDGSAIALHNPFGRPRLLELQPELRWLDATLPAHPSKDALTRRHAEILFPRIEVQRPNTRLLFWHPEGNVVHRGFPGFAYLFNVIPGAAFAVYAPPPRSAPPRECQAYAGAESGVGIYPGPTIEADNPPHAVIGWGGAVSADGRWFAGQDCDGLFVAARSGGGVVRVSPLPLKPVAIGKDKRFVVAYGPHERQWGLHLFDASGAQPVALMPPVHSSRFVVSGDETRIAVAGSSTLFLVDLRDRTIDRWEARYLNRDVTIVGVQGRSILAVDWAGQRVLRWRPGEALPSQFPIRITTRDRAPSKPYESVPYSSNADGTIVAIVLGDSIELVREDGVHITLQVVLADGVLVPIAHAESGLTTDIVTRSTSQFVRVEGDWNQILDPAEGHALIHRPTLVSDFLAGRPISDRPTISGN